MPIENISNSDWMYKPGGLGTSTAIQGKDPSKMDMNDFFKLLVAQMTNQDMLNPTNDTEFIAQMAQFAALQGVQSIQEYQLSSYATSYVGKNVTIADVNDKGDLVTIEGFVERVTFYDGKPQVVVGGKTYDLHKVMEVSPGDGVPSGGSGAGNSVSLSEASSYIGKTVKVEYLGSDKVQVVKQGVVESALMKDGTVMVIIDGKTHPASAITTVNPKDEPAAGGEEGTTET